MLVGEGQLKPVLMQRASELGLRHVIFLEPVAKDRLAGLLAASDLGLQILANVPAFYHGTSPNKFFDYLSAGLPVLINYPGWLADVIRAEQCGYVVPPVDAGALADALEHAVANRETLRGMGRRARSLAQGRFDRDMLADSFVDELELAVTR